MSAIFVQPSSTETVALDGIAHAFFSTLDRDGGPRLELAGAVVVLVLLALLVRWVRRDSLRDRVKQDALDARHTAAIAVVGHEQRHWVRVPARLRLAVKHEPAHHLPFSEHCETVNLGGGGLAFSTQAPPEAGVPIQFALDLGEKRPLALEGVVVRIEPLASTGAGYLVAVKLGPITAGAREEIIRWVAHEETREIAEARRGRLCSICRRPLAEDAGNVHSACAERVVNEQPRCA
jgi:hypothetical protein